jgi:hypothetical protein
VVEILVALVNSFSKPLRVLQIWGASIIVFAEESHIPTLVVLSTYRTRWIAADA